MEFDSLTVCHHLRKKKGIKSEEVDLNWVSKWLWEER
jgi:hypothetical protein